MPYRQDRDVTREAPAFRRILAHLTPDRDSASVFFTQTLDLSKTLPWLEEHNQATDRKIRVLHLFLAAAGRMLHEHPRLNRYVSGWRIYQRQGVYVTLSVKKALRDGARLVMLKMPVEEGDGIEEIHDRLHDMVHTGRSGDAPVEKEMSAFLHIPGFLLHFLVKLILWLDRRHWLPAFFADPDPMFTSLAVANLGSVGMDPAYHHLYEYGNCPFFAVIGKIHERPVAVDGGVEVRPVMEIRYTFDERVEDGLACAQGLAGLKELMEDPERWVTGITDLQGRPPSAC